MKKIKGDISPSLGRVFLVGYYGCGNLGDEWLLSFFKKYFKEKNIKYTVLSGKKPKKNEVSRKNIIAVWRSIRHADTVVFGGGSILQNDSSNKSLVYYLTLIALAKKYNKRVMLIGQGIGPIEGGVMTILTKKVLKRVDFISVRDDESKRLLDQWKIRSIEAADMVFQDIPERCQASGEAGVIACNLMPWKQKWPQGWKEIKQRIMQVSSFGLSMSTQDKKAMKGLSVYNLRESPLEPVTDKEISLIICFRYHVAVWAVLHGIPFIVVDKNTKSRALARACGQEWISVKDKTMTLKDLDSKIARVKKNWAFYANNALKARQELHEKAVLNEMGLK